MFQTHALKRQRENTLILFTKISRETVLTVTGNRRVSQHRGKTAGKFCTVPQGLEEPGWTVDVAVW